MKHFNEINSAFNCLLIKQQSNIRISQYPSHLKLLGIYKSIKIAFLSKKSKDTRILLTFNRIIRCTIVRFVSCLKSSSVKGVRL